MTTPHLTQAGVMIRLIDAVRAAGGESAFARVHGLPRQDVHEAMAGRRHPGPGMLRAVGVRKVTRYELIPPPAAAPQTPQNGG